MALRMVRLTRSLSGRWAARKVIPADVREAYGQGEAKRTWDAGLTEGQAKAAMAAWLAEIENRIAALRAVAKPADTLPALDLSQRECRALAGLWYEDLKARYEANPGDAEGWRIAQEEVIPEETAATYHLTAEEAEGLPLRVSPWLKREAVALLACKGLRLTDGATDRLHQDMASLWLRFADLMVQRAQGDWSPDPLPRTLPAWQEPAAKAPKEEAKGPTITELFDAYVRERQPKERTSVQWRRYIGRLERFLGHDDASRITKADIVRFKDHLLTVPSKATGKTLDANTVRNAYLAAAKAVFQAAVDNGRLPSNPVADVKVRAPKKARLRDPSLTDDEAHLILSAALSVTYSQPPHPAEYARRWVPWICAYTGARVSEITQLRKCDVVEREGVWAIHITPEAGSVKTEEARWVPLHSHLIEQGFVAFVQASREGPLFYVPRKEEKPGQPPAYKRTGERLAAWVREIGVTDPAVQPNHGWRHRFKTVGRGRLDAEARDRIAGHKPRTEGEAYGTWTLRSLSEQVEKLPRYDLPAGQGVRSGES
ncbi:integrase family protein [Novosphingobium nitrogenifigens DSM 19370]|uniref:Integrase family protein n=1 Tax=Novosphingobium nitrogenifigens DSM 19370 TaxID=983920 RepID=F1Z3N3_9SPHN|nr:phage integrase SAM-like domain-containing protein [Novosphingobium nitrogenifigens]EGD60847.1 integrase family protein [Novosphingobium nitrogenifigens DSM 19370]